MLKFPFGEADTLVLSATGAQALTVKDNFTYVDGVTAEATANRTLNVTVDDQVEIGARLLVASKTDGTETTIFGTGITGATITGVAGKTITKEFVYTGSAFVAVGEQID